MVNITGLDANEVAVSFSERTKDQESLILNRYLLDTNVGIFKVLHSILPDKLLNDIADEALLNSQCGFRQSSTMSDVIFFLLGNCRRNIFS